jgi:hypothetical protein
MLEDSSLLLGYVTPFHLLVLLGCLALTMKAARFFQTLMTVYQSKRRAHTRRIGSSSVPL